jgi:hypothetical protein
MPEISRFYGIVIHMFFNEHPPPHFHAKYGEFEVAININNLSILHGIFPSRALGMTIEWASAHQQELKRLWEKLRDGQPIERIEPLH